VKEKKPIILPSTAALKDTGKLERIKTSSSTTSNILKELASITPNFSKDTLLTQETLVPILTDKLGLDEIIKISYVLECKKQKLLEAALHRRKLLIIDELNASIVNVADDQSMTGTSPNHSFSQ